MNEIVQYFERKQLVLFIDSGISIYDPTFLPTKREFVHLILHALSSVSSESLKGIYQNLLSYELPVWECLKTIRQEAGQLYLDPLKLFSSSPNHLYKEIAKMIVQKELKMIVQTSWDDCLEKALEEEGWKEGRDFLVLDNKSAWANWHPENEKPVIFKFYGSLRNTDTFQENLETYQDGLGTEKAQILSYIFKKYYSIFLGIDGVSPYFHTFILETLPCSCPGITCVSQDMALLRNIRTANYIYGHNINTTHESEARFLESLISRHVENLDKEIWIEDKIAKVREKQLISLKEWAQEIGIFGCHQIFTILASKAGEYELASQCGEMALKIAKIQMNAQELARVFFVLSEAYTQDIPQALQYLEKCLNIVQKLNQPLAIAEVYMKFGNLYLQQQQWELSVRHYSRALEIYHANGKEKNVAEVYTKLGSVYEKQNNLGESLACYEKSLEIYSPSKEETKIAKVYNQIGRVYFQKQEIDKSKDYYCQAQEIAWNGGDIETMAKIYTNLAAIAYQEKDFTNAYRLYRRAGIILEQIRENEGAGAVYYNLALMRYTCDDPERARKYFHRASVCWSKSPNRHEYQKIQELLVELDKKYPHFSGGNEAGSNLAY